MANAEVHEIRRHALDHVFFSQTRAWMAVVMGATVAAREIGEMKSLIADPERGQ